jgi:hypothetical protein
MLLLGLVWVGLRYIFMFDLRFEHLFKTFYEIVDLIAIGFIVVPLEKALDAVTKVLRKKDHTDVQRAYTETANRLVWPAVVFVLLCLVAATVFAHLAQNGGVHAERYRLGVLLSAVAAVGVWSVALWKILTIDIVVTAILCPVGSFSLVVGVVIVSIVVSRELVDYTYLGIPVRIHVEMWKRVAEALIMVFLLDVAKTWRDKKGVDSSDKDKKQSWWHGWSLKAIRTKRVGIVLTKEAWPAWLFVGGIIIAWIISYLCAIMHAIQLLDFRYCKATHRLLKELSLPLVLY